jgi:osmotically-inducible protein OsmY
MKKEIKQKIKEEKKINDEIKETMVKSISVFFSRVKVKLSDGEVLIFKGFPISIIK